MATRNTLLASKLTVAAISFGHASPGAAQRAGEVGYEAAYVAGTNTTSQVKAEFRAYQANPAASDGVLIVGGELGYVYSSTHRVDLVDGRLVHKDEMAHNAPRPDWKMSDEERRAFSEQYIN